jgi:predicted alpha/beta hydrolase family esterase
LPHALRVRQQNWDTPEPQAWIAALAATVEAAPWPVLLVAHSLGCITAASLPTALRSKVAGALLVAPADVERPGAPDCLRAFAPVPRHSLPFQSVVVASDDDPYCPLARAAGFAQDWGSRLVILNGAGHINAAAGYGNWPDGLKLLRALRRRAAWRVTPPMRRISPVSGLAQP